MRRPVTLAGWRQLSSQRIPDEFSKRKSAGYAGGLDSSGGTDLHALASSGAKAIRSGGTEEGDVNTARKQ